MLDINLLLHSFGYKWTCKKFDEESVGVNTVDHGPSFSDEFFQFLIFVFISFSDTNFIKVLKSGNIVGAQMGDANASIPTPQPVYMRPMFSSLGKAAAACSIAFVSRRCLDTGIGNSYGLGTSL